MAAEVVEVLAPRADGRYVDCTFGRGGHTRAILERLGPSARVLALDRDPQAVDAARELARSDPRVLVRHACFGELGRIVHAAGLTGRIDGVLMDLGVSSPQLDQPDRGFSFANDGPLDLRMDPGAGVSAAQWLASATASEIERVLREYGEERAARRISRALVAERERGAPITSTRRLAAVVAGGRTTPCPDPDSSGNPCLPGHPGTHQRRNRRAGAGTVLGAEGCSFRAGASW